MWEQRVKRAVNDSVAEGVLFGNSGLREDEIHFANLPLEEMQEAQAEMWRQWENAA